MSRYYAVRKKADLADVALVEADTKAGALRFVAEKTLTAESVSQKDLVKLMQAGVRIETAKSEAKEEAPKDDRDGKVWP